MTSGLTGLLKTKVMSYYELDSELKLTIKEAKKVPIGSFRYVKLKHKATALHNELLRIEKMGKNFK
jgi:hypothetical protein